jgi:hypothetical protein
VPVVPSPYAIEMDRNRGPIGASLKTILVPTNALPGLALSWGGCVGDGEGDGDGACADCASVDPWRVTIAQAKTNANATSAARFTA